MNLQGQRVVVTGASSGIGKYTAIAMAERGAEVVLAGRSEDRTLPVVNEIRQRFGEHSASFLPMDLASFTSVRRATQTLLNQGIPIRVLINNAGVGGVKGVTQDGFEEHFGTNHLGHFLFTLPLIPLIIQAGQSRIVNVTSETHALARTIPFEHLTKPARFPTGFPEYTVSKLANLLFTKDLAERLRPYGVSTFAIHPGVVGTNVWREYPILKFAKWAMLSEEQGAENTVFCATEPSIHDQTGQYWEKKKIHRSGKASHNIALRDELWTRSETWTDCRWEDLNLPPAP